jgi:hypothetical protein
MPLIQRDDAVQHLSTATADPPFRNCVCQGAWILVRFGSKPVAARNWTTSILNFESWSKMRTGRFAMQGIQSRAA